MEDGAGECEGVNAEDLIRKFWRKRQESILFFYIFFLIYFYIIFYNRCY